jgi:hypothetical protein
VKPARFFLLPSPNFSPHQGGAVPLDFAAACAIFFLVAARLFVYLSQELALVFGVVSVPPGVCFLFCVGLLVSVSRSSPPVLSIHRPVRQEVFFASFAQV